jgi:membrane-bound ClpP family serine protease
MKTTFTKKNYYVLIAGIVLIVLGYILMIGGKSEDPNVFNEEVFSFQRITLAPMVCLIGFVTIIVAIMWRPKVAEAETGK